MKFFTRRTIVQAAVLAATAFTGMTAFSTALFRARCRLIGSCAFGSCLVSAILAAAGSQEQGERRRAREIKALHH